MRYDGTVHQNGPEMNVHPEFLYVFHIVTVDCYRCTAMYIRLLTFNFKDLFNERDSCSIWSTDIRNVTKMNIFTKDFQYTIIS